MKTTRRRTADPILPLTPDQVMANFSRVYSLPEAQQRLWHLVLPALLDSFRKQDAAQTNRLVAFYEHLELLLKATYHTPAGEGRVAPTPTAPYAT